MIKRVLLSIWCIAVICLNNIWAYDFSVVVPSGQRLYFDSYSSSDEVVVTYPQAPNNWGTTIKPSGNLIIPNIVVFEGQAYRVVAIGNSAFEGCRDLTSVEIPNTVRTIQSYAFRNCIGLIGVDIPNSVTSIWTHAFSGCTKLRNINIPNAVTNIDSYAFYSCESLNRLVVPESVTFIGNEAFSYCTGLCIFLPNTLNVIGENAFRFVKAVNYCGDIEGAPWGAVRSGCFYETNDFLYEDSTKATTLAYIGTYHRATIPNTVTCIGENTFRNCYISEVDIPNSVTTIERNSFALCSDLTSITLPNSIDSIGNSSFLGCSSLSEIVSKSEEAPKLGSNVFDGINADIIVEIPCSSLSSYTERWPYFHEYHEEIPYSFFVYSNGELAGEVQVLVEPNCSNNGSAEVLAIAYDGYHFTHWSNGAINNPINIEVNEDTYLTAFFEVGDPVGIKVAKEISIDCRNGIIDIHGTNGETIIVCDIMGHVVLCGRVIDGHKYIIPNRGIYVLRVGKYMVQKLMVR